MKKRTALMRGTARVLAMVSIVPLLYGWTWTTSTLAAGGTNPGTQEDLVDGSHITWSTTPPPVITPSDVASFHVELWTTLFGGKWSAEQWTYALEAPVSGAGAYGGANHLGQAFTLEVVDAEPVDLPGIGLPPAVLGALIADDYAFTDVIGILASDLDAVHLHGLAVSRQLDGQAPEHVFIPTYAMDPGSAWFYADGGYVDELEGGLLLKGVPVGGDGDGTSSAALQAAVDLQITAQLDDNVTLADCIDDAIADYDARMAICNGQRTTAIAACNATYNTAIANAVSSAKLCRALIIAVEVTCLTACVLGTGGWGLVACYFACAAVTAASYLTCEDAYNSAVSNAVATRNGCIATANGNHAACAELADFELVNDIADCGGASTGNQQ